MWTFGRDQVVAELRSIDPDIAEKAKSQLPDQIQLDPHAETEDSRKLDQLGADVSQVIQRLTGQAWNPGTAAKQASAPAKEASAPTK